MRHWDDIKALKRRIGVDDTFRPEVFHPLRPQVMTEKMHVTSFSFENMTPQAERFLRQKFHLNKTDSIDANLEQALTTSMRVDLFYQTAECHLLPEGDGVRVVLVAGNRKSEQLNVGVRFDIEEYAAVQLGLDIPLKTAIPVNADLTLRLGKRLMARGDLTIHPRSFTRPTLSYTFYRNDIDVYMDGDRSADEFIYVAMNMHWEMHGFTLPQLPPNMAWFVFANTGMAAPEDIFEPGMEPILKNQREVLVGARSIIILVGREKSVNSHE